jgi:hypothetical protein
VSGRHRKGLQHRRRGRAAWHKVRAVLAAGVVLGLGVTATQSVFTDSVFGSGNIQAGHFRIEGNPRYQSEGTQAWNFYPQSNPAIFVCKDYFHGPGPGVPARDTALNMVPGAPAYCAVSLRAATGAGPPPDPPNPPNSPSRDAQVSILGASFTPNDVTNNLSYSVRRITDTVNGRAVCASTGWDQAAVEIPGWPANARLSEGSAAPLTLPANGTIVHLCFEIKISLQAPSSARGASSGPVTWRLDGVPVIP